MSNRYPDPISELAGLITRVSSLDVNQAKTVVCYAVLSHALPKLRICPILSIEGPMGTGKTMLLDILQILGPQEPIKLDGKDSSPVIRDGLRENTLALLDEADDVGGAKEKLLINRYSRTSAIRGVKRGSSKEGWVDTYLNMFGALAIHRRAPFRDPAVLSRAVVIKTRRRGDVGAFIAEEFHGYQEALAALADDLPWETIQRSHGSRLADTWAPLRFVAEQAGDEEWLAWANHQIQSAQRGFDMNQDEEPGQLVYQALLSQALVNGDLPPDRRVRLANVADEVRERGSDLSPWQVGHLLRDMGFDVRTVGGRQWVYTGGAEHLKEVGRSLGVTDEWIDGEDEA